MVAAKSKTLMSHPLPSGASELLALGVANVHIVCHCSGSNIQRIQWDKGQDSVVGIATRYGLDGPVIESRWGAIFFTTV